MEILYFDNQLLTNNILSLPYCFCNICKIQKNLSVSVLKNLSVASFLAKSWISILCVYLAIRVNKQFLSRCQIKTRFIKIRTSKHVLSVLLSFSDIFGLRCVLRFSHLKGAICFPAKVYNYRSVWSAKPAQVRIRSRRSCKMSSAMIHEPNILGFMA